MTEISKPKYNEVQIIASIDQIFVPGSYFHSEYIVTQLKSKKSIDLILQILDNSGKTPAEAIIVLLAVIRYISKDIHALKKIEESNSFSDFLDKHNKRIKELSIKGKVQGNAPERALPIMEILGKMLPEENIAIIELGASFGLIGHALLSPQLLFQQENYFLSNQQFPTVIGKTEKYLGIDLNPPDKDWLLACFSNIDDTIRIKSYLDNLKEVNNFKLIKASAFGFSSFNETNTLLNDKLKPVILTSFMMYQLDFDQQISLKTEIIEFCKNHDAHWIQQEVDLSKGLAHAEYFVAWDEKKILLLNDDKCTNWKWL